MTDVPADYQLTRAEILAQYQGDQPPTTLLERTLMSLNTGYRTAGTVGAATVSVSEEGTPYHHHTVMTLEDFALTVGDDGALGTGALLYTFPTGVIIVEAVSISLGVTLQGTPTTDTPDFGIGTVIAEGEVSVLSGTGTFENILTGQLLNNLAGTAEVATAIPTAGVPLVIAAAAAHTVYLNIADTYADLDATDALVAGTVILDWRYMGA